MTESALAVSIPLLERDLNRLKSIKPCVVVAAYCYINAQYAEESITRFLFIK